MSALEAGAWWPHLWEGRVLSLASGLSGGGLGLLGGHGVYCWALLLRQRDGERGSVVPAATAPASTSTSAPSSPPPPLAELLRLPPPPQRKEPETHPSSYRLCGTSYDSEHCEDKIQRNLITLRMALPRRCKPPLHQCRGDRPRRKICLLHDNRS